MRVPLGLRIRLERYFRARMPDADAVAVTRLEQLTEGFSQETFLAEVEVAQGGAPEHRAYVVKRAPAAGLLEPYNLEPEFRVLHALTDTAFPSPPTPWFEADPGVLGRPFYVMERLPGTAPISAVKPDGSLPFSAAERETLASEIAGTLAMLHGLDWRALGLASLGVPGPDVAARELRRWEVRLAASGLAPHPAVTAALLWMKRHLPVADEIVLVHGDYRLGNFLVDDPGDGLHLAGVLDWEMVHLGDPVEDLGWCLCPLWRAGSALACTVAPPEELVQLYADTRDRGVDPARLHFYGVFSLVKMVAVMSSGVAAYRSGRTEDLRMAIFDHQLPALHALLAETLAWGEGGP